LEDLRRVFSRLLGLSEGELPFEFYERDGELVAHQNGYIPEYDDWFKIFNYARQVGRVEQDEEDRSWYFVFPKTEELPESNEKPSGLPLHLRMGTATKESLKPLEPGYYPEFPVDRIITHPFSFRVNVDEGLNELVSEIRSAGMIIEPLVCRPADKPGYVELCAGERRLRATRKIGMRTVPIIVKEMDDVEFDRVRLLENLARKDLSDIEIARVLKYMLEKYPEEYPSQEALADALGKSRQWVFYHLQMLKLEDLLTRVNKRTGFLSKITEFQAREILSAPPDKRVEVAEWIIEKYEETGEIPSAREIREFVRPVEAIEAPEILEIPEVEESKPTIPCDGCGKPVTTPVHLKGKFYCEECARKVLSEKPAKPPLSKSVVLEVLEKNLFNIYPEGVELEKIRKDLEEYDTSSLSDLLLELMDEGVIALHKGKWMPREEYEKQQAVLDDLRAKAREAERALIGRYEGFAGDRGFETYTVSEIRKIAEKNGPTKEFLEDLRSCVEAHKEFYRALHHQDVFSPVKGDPTTENIDGIDRYLRRAKPVKPPGGSIGMLHRCPICGRGDLSEKAWERMKRKYGQMSYEEFKKLWEEAWK